MSAPVPFWPEQASAASAQVDLLTITFSAMTVLLALPVFVLIFVFAVRYRRGKAADRKHQINRNVWLEVSWAIIPFILMLGFYAWSTRLFFANASGPTEALEIYVVAKQWMWKFQHPGGQREINELHVPAGRPVKLVMASQDVIHSLFIPALRLKQDVVPGRYTSLQFNADKPGTYRLTCAEFCGADHSEMGGSFVLLTPDAYAGWLEEADVDQDLAADGARLFRSHGCSGCHGPASTVKAPDLHGVYGSPVPLQNGQVVIADEQYIRDSILRPQSQVAAGYPPIMPTFENILSEEELVQLVAYVKSLATSDDVEDARP